MPLSLLPAHAAAAAYYATIAPHLLLIRYYFADVRCRHVATPVYAMPPPALMIEGRRD